MQKRPRVKLNKDLIVSSEIDAASGPIRRKVVNKIKVLDKIRLSVINSINKKSPIPVFNNLMPIVSSLEVLQLAYGNIKSNKGALTKGTTPKTAEAFSQDRILQIQQQLKQGTYKFARVRRIWIPKPLKIDWSVKQNLIDYGRPLGMPDFDSKIIQEAIRIVLNAIYEPIFDIYNVSHGFRPKRGCHTALANISFKAQAMTCAIEGDIKGAYNNVNHEILIKIISKRVYDNKFLDLIKNACQAGIFDELQQTNADSLIGVPQGGIVSPLLWNIYMHEFDKFVVNDITFTLNSINKRQKRCNTAPNLLYKSLIAKQTAQRKKYEKLTNGKTAHLKNLSPEEFKLAVQAKNAQRSFKKLIIKTPSRNISKQTIRFHYVRYADDWILFTNAKSTVAQYMKRKIASFLKYQLGLTLSNEKTKITNLKTDKAKFLGFTIYFAKHKKIAYTNKGALKRVTGQRPIIGIDTSRVIPRFEWRGYLKKDKPREQPAWSTLTDYEIVAKYNSVIRGLVNYYTPLINTRSSINYLVYILEYSCYKTLCQKHRTTIRALMRNYGFPLTVDVIENGKRQKSVQLITVRTYWPKLKDTVLSIKNSLRNNTHPEIEASSDFLENAKTYWRTQFKLIGRCCVCGSTDAVEMHHIKHIRKLSDKPRIGFEKIMQLLNRKQVPVCSYHHDMIHAGKYDDMALADLYDIRIATVENYLRL